MNIKRTIKPAVTIPEEKTFTIELTELEAKSLFAVLGSTTLGDAIHQMEDAKENYDNLAKVDEVSVIQALSKFCDIHKLF
jgi:hypothetical protein